MITVNINTIGRRCNIKLSDSIFKVRIERRFKIARNSGWRNTLIFLTLFKGIIKLLEIKLLYRLKNISGT